ncbi:MAG: DUF998 domain-containing protein [Promethearchaeota archaeon]
MRYGIGGKMESFFTIFGNVFGVILIVLAVVFTPGYSPLTNTISSLGGGRAKSLFSIAFVVMGALNIPFFIQLERELVNIKESIRRLATALSIISSVAVSLVGIIPDETYINLFIIFHAFVAYLSFVGTGIYIGLYSVLMYMGPKSKLYRGPSFKRNHAYFGFLIVCVLILFVVTNIPLIEWILATIMMIWLVSTAIQMLSFQFFDIPGLYYKKTQFPDALKLFEDAIQILDRLDMQDEPITGTLKKNIEYLKNQIKEKT